MLESRNVPSAVNFSTTAFAVNENQGTATVTVTLDHSSASPISVNYNTMDGSALAGSDYTAASGTLNFAPGETSKTFNVTILNDSNSEGDESLGLMLSSPSGATLGTPSAASLTITDDDVNQPPQISGQSFSLTENSPVATVVGTVAASDPNAGQTLNYAITGGNSDGAFTIDSATGVISVADDIPLDYETTPQFVLAVTVTDNGSPSLSSTAQVTINLLNVNEAPAASPVYIDAIGTGGSVLNLVGSDEEGSSLTVSVTSLPTRGRLYDGPDASGHLITASDLNSGSYQLTDPLGRVFYLPDANKYGFDEFAFRVNDGTQDSAVVSAGLFVAPTGGAPVVANGVAFDYTETGGAMALDLLGAVEDPEGDPLTVTFGQPDHGSLIYDAQSASYLYTPEANFTGVATFALEVSDGTHSTKVEATVFCQRGPAGVPVNVQRDVSQRVNQNISFGTHDASTPATTGNFSRFEQDLTSVISNQNNTRVGATGSYTLNRQQTDTQFGALPTASLNANEAAVRGYLATVPGVVPASISVTTRTDIFWNIRAAPIPRRRDLNITFQLYLVFNYQTTTTVGGQQVTTSYSGVSTVITPSYNDFFVILR